MDVFIFITIFLFTLLLGFYLITTLQWFSYKFERVIFHFTKPIWHLFFLIVPILFYYALSYVNFIYFAVYFYIIFIPTLYFWHKKLDKKLVFTSRVKRFFVILCLVTLFIDIFLIKKVEILPIFLPLIISFLISFIFESFNSKLFIKSACEKLASMPNLTIIEITASYGKTSIKNFLYQILQSEFKCYKTPRSVNTLMGLVKDINENLSPETEIYIAEAGARKNGDIAQITQFLKPSIIIVGEIGKQHIEYFKTIENIRNTKLEALNSPNLKVAFVHSSTQKIEDEKTQIYDKNLSKITSNLEGIKFEMKLNSRDYEFETKLLGEFNASNLAACINVANYLKVDIKTIQNSVLNLKSVEHRLEKIEAGGKFIIDDSFNGNFEGMSKSYDLVRSFDGRKVIVTPGIVEATKEMNESLAKKIDEIFDLVIITGELNAEIFKSIIDENKLILVKDKRDLTQILGEKTRAGDLILFSNDAPSFI
ncbi:UDP-N-acetylmuramoyl-tripeptide--D-alanyl-D-alanine ligase [Campylobacter sp. RM12327]|uniref:Mur ligase family protein n=1 Tax=Campylobacter sputorum TaxID=206 RepID=UPI000B785203|nr:MULTISPECIES: UDP-N-acetylmuramoyl-tripeptide--D-alanyl-D-alanine ligase [Campylobacter]ASM39303.1 D-alanyl-D-alanine-adding enzyme [Campylobacter sputorum]MBE7358472.1 UDP-N-acetylmuramoyl-tripeptide--D-alanyl-D-alanine ligase [Campylobacter sp. RM11302]MBF6669353.1 UDP-N-acetylmuramoyl-tripeptide--D-alanyl-D-alanine ligase [Campylobacter sp. RM12327]MBF6674621.1 UDP-N-acetylmuramoyl-tripeptide--D-alanyl-D-alanine ligase [Campylobacter sp. RM13538]MBF6676128.1 UDP-N-acetylmuramoyl-tripepti